MENQPQGLASGAKLGRYEVVRLLGKGGMGEVYLAKDLSLGREMVQAVTTQDLSIIMGITVLSAVLVIAANFLVDVCHALLDPRVRLK